MVSEGDANKEIATHARGYAGFIRMMTWGTVISLVVALIVVLIISE